MPFVLHRTIPSCPRGSINCLTFSYDQQYLAAGGDDGRVYIYPFHISDAPPLKIRYQTAVTSLEWVSDGHSLFVGLASGHIHLLKLGGDSGCPRDVLLSDEFVEEVTSLTFNDDRLCVASGETVKILDVSRMDQGIRRTTILLKSIMAAGGHPDVRFDDPREVRGVKFLNGGTSLLVASLASGVTLFDFGEKMDKPVHSVATAKRVGTCAVDITETYMSIFNVNDGFDIYHLQSDRYVGSFTIVMAERVFLPSIFLNGRQEIVLGAADGNVKIVRLPDLVEIDHLPHDGDMIQALSQCTIGHPAQRYVVTGCAEKGEATYIKVWRFEESAPSTPTFDRAVLIGSMVGLLFTLWLLVLSVTASDQHHHPFAPALPAAGSSCS